MRGPDDQTNHMFSYLSPEQISGWLKIHHPNDESMRVSHETKVLAGC